MSSRRDGLASCASRRSRISDSWPAVSVSCSAKPRASSGSPASLGAARIWARACTSMAWTSVRYSTREGMLSRYPIGSVGLWRLVLRQPGERGVVGLEVRRWTQRLVVELRVAGVGRRRLVGDVGVLGRDRGLAHALDLPRWYI